MNISAIKLSIISMPLKQPFHTHLGTVKEREAIIVEAIDREGLSGFGEGVAFSSPWYTEETVATSWHVLTEFLLPLLKRNPVSHPREVFGLFSGIRRNHMAKSAIELALWDLYAKQKQVPLARLLGAEMGSAPFGTEGKSPGAERDLAGMVEKLPRVDRIPSGVVVASKDEAEALEQTAKYVEEGYQRVKVKISPANDYKLLSAIRGAFSNLPIMADANSAYSLDDAERLKVLDELNLLMIEQPLAHNDFIEHAKLQKQISTPLCLDESINSYSDAVMAIAFGSCRVIAVKAGKVGGLGEAVRIHDFCKAEGIPVWCGGMIEFGISRAHNIALASLPGFTIPGDLSSSSRFWEEDIIEPEITVEDGWISIPRAPGIGFSINRKRLEQVTLREEVYRFN
ncbi:o-succinylbenzoate synthase [Neobacillus notoginsengisoli]|uniref:o-succinylbenzoate synthase n=1 Tax=Neobacillus notoginsengisoli TaxID=1578198 RepID=A0A417YDL9_9BACI|nr:o-succinylbenzoate synthase [Neobacillus notoginsengisoli]RHW30745.1 o-succinylbenzoate synthase [Neobacillus notoginsengisoli]